MNNKLIITGIQTGLFWEDKKANLQMLEEKILGINQKTELIVLPEMFSTGFSMQAEKLAENMQGETVSWMKKIAAAKNSILIGSLIISETAENGRNLFFNRMVMMFPNGQVGYYDKRHRFAYAEEDKYYTAGDKRMIASVKGWKINLQVCYDLRFPVWSRQNSLEATNGTITPEFDLLIYVANWPDKRIHAWKTLLQARAIENQCYVVGVNRVGKDGKDISYTGDSMVVDPLGEVLYTSTAKEDIFTLTLDKSALETIREKFPFWKDADRFRIEK